MKQKATTLLWELLETKKFTPMFWSIIYELILGYIPKFCLRQLIEDSGSGDYVKANVFHVIDIFCEKFDLLQAHSKDFIERINAFI